MSQRYRTISRMITPRFHFRIGDDGWPIYDRPEVVKAYLQGIAHKGDLEATFQPWRKEKSLQQLRYIHGVVFALCSQASGYTIPEVKGLLKGEFLTDYCITKDGKKLPYVKSLADLTMTEMREFIDECIILAAKHWSVVIPSPEEATV
jgi:hypothetical protein